MRPWSTSSFIGLLWLFACTANAAINVRLLVNSHVQAAPEGKTGPVERQQSIDLTLADHIMVVKDENSTVVYDFAKRTRVVIDDKGMDRRRVDYSLYDTVGFRATELRNRQGLSKMLAAAKITQRVMSDIDNENELGIQDKPSAPLQKTTDSADEIFADGDEILFRRSKEGTPVSEADARMFTQFVRYCFGGHPQALRAMQEEHTIPARLTLVTRGVAQTTRTLSIESVRVVDEPQLNVAQIPLCPAGSTEDPVDRVLDSAASFTPADRDAALQRSRNDLAAAWSEGRAVDAYLGLVEETLMTGEPLPALSQQQSELLRSSDPVQRLSRALAAHSNEDLTNAIAQIESLHTSAATKAYVFKIFEANDRAMLGQQDPARKLFLEVLAVNPQIAGVYKVNRPGY